jgi:hypothetical protein
MRLSGKSTRPTIAIKRFAETLPMLQQGNFFGLPYPGPSYSTAAPIQPTTQPTANPAAATVGKNQNAEKSPVIVTTKC